MSQLVKAVFFDIDGTQLREDIHRAEYSEQDLELIQKLKARLEELASRGIIVVHATNRMANLVLQDMDLLASAKYITCSASTQILVFNPKTQQYEDDQDYNKLVAGCNFSPEKCWDDSEGFDELILTDSINQTDRKVSYTFKSGTTLERRHEIHQALKSKQSEGVEVFMVEGGDNHIIDFLPIFCTKAAVVSFIMKKENLEPNNVLAAGNSNNDIPMLDVASHAIAVSDSRPSLLEAFQRSQDEGKNGHVVAPLPNTAGVLWALEQHCL